ncbi:MAG: polysaccharide biosynthesis tyrosine autokinase [Bacilli bacterium]|nr:polysaccharide biosynthesis tyrosine autokinase [Bacilli bacterium]
MEDIEIKEFLIYMRDKIWIILIALVVSLITTIVYVNNFKKPLYDSSSTYVLISDSNEKEITTTEVALNEKLIATYKEIIKSRNIMKKVIERLNLENENPISLAKKISVEQISSSAMIKITVRYNDPKLAKDIAYRTGREFSKEIANLYKLNNVSMIDEPLVPDTPANQSNTKEIVIINGGAFVISILIIFLLFYFDNTIKSEEQIKEKIKKPVLGVIPVMSKKKVNDAKKELIVHDDPKSPVSEGIRTLRTNLQFTNIDKKIKKIMVTSSMPGEGKSFTSVNLAVAFAQDGKNVLILDCDMRKGRIHKLFGLSNGKGLSNLLIDNMEENYKKYIKKTDIENLSVLTSGLVPPNPSELLNSETNKELIKILEKEYDYLIFDCVPTNGLPDSLIMTNFADQVIIVCENKKTPTDLLQKTKQSLETVDANIAGVVLNKTNGKYSKYYGHYY